MIVTNTPYREISIPANARTVVLTFSTSPESVSVVGDTLYGAAAPQGMWPLTHKPNSL